MPNADAVSSLEHEDAVPVENRYASLNFRGDVWDLGHLNSFAFRADIGQEPNELLVDVVVLFSCHCFTVAEKGQLVPAGEYYTDGREVRILCLERYVLSQKFLPRLVKELFTRKIRVASDMPNYITVEVLEGEVPGFYAIFFFVQKDRKRKKRMILRVQSAYRIEALTQRQSKAGKVNFDVLLRATYLGRKIKG